MKDRKEGGGRRREGAERGGGRREEDGHTFTDSLSPEEIKVSMITWAPLKKSPN